jgi:hypothetical protein
VSTGVHLLAGEPTGSAAESPNASRGEREKTQLAVSLRPEGGRTQVTNWQGWAGLSGEGSPFANTSHRQKTFSSQLTPALLPRFRGRNSSNLPRKETCGEPPGRKPPTLAGKFPGQTNKKGYLEPRSPFFSTRRGGPVPHYLARYTHRVAISNHRLLSLSDSLVA